MSIIVAQYLPMLISVDSDKPRKALAAIGAAADIVALCDRVLALPSGVFPRQGITQAEAQRAARTVKHVMFGR